MESSKEPHWPSLQRVVTTSAPSSCVVNVLDHPTPSQPKLHNGRMMEPYWLKVPRIFTNLEEWLEWLQEMPAWKWYGIIIRSEHPEEWVINARSWILDSVIITYATELSTRKRVFNMGNHGYTESKSEVIEYIYWEYLKAQTEQAKLVWYDSDKVSFSVWECIDGDNYTVVEDKGNPGYYFIHGWYDENIRLLPFRRESYNKASSVDKKLINEYFKVQKSGKFWKTPIVELQHQFLPIDEWGKITWKEGDIFFLQALQIYDWVQRNFSLLNRPMERDERSAIFVRGATPPEWIEVSLQVEYGNIPYNNQGDGWFFWSSNLSDGRKKLLLETVFSLAGSKIVLLSLDVVSSVRMFWKNPSKLTELEIARIIHDHVWISFVHKPQMCIVIAEDFMNDRLVSRRGLIRLRIVSDGKKAYIKELD